MECVPSFLRDLGSPQVTRSGRGGGRGRQPGHLGSWVGVCGIEKRLWVRPCGLRETEMGVDGVEEKMVTGKIGSW